MTQSELVSELEKESSRRKKEIVNLMLDVLSMTSTNSADALLQACVVLLYAHLEGFVKKSSRQYLQFIEEQTSDLQGLSEEWLDRQSVVNVARLREIVWCMRIDYHPFKHKEIAVRTLAKRRNKIAHGGQLDEEIRIRKGDVRKMADDVYEIIEFFKSGLIKIVSSE